MFRIIFVIIAYHFIKIILQSASERQKREKAIKIFVFNAIICRLFLIYFLSIWCIDGSSKLAVFQTFSRYWWGSGQKVYAEPSHNLENMVYIFTTGGGPILARGPRQLPSSDVWQYESWCKNNIIAPYYFFRNNVRLLRY